MQAGIWRNKRRRPPHHHLIVREALRKSGIHYKDFVMFYNKHDQMQYIDFLFKYKGRFVALLWDYKRRKKFGTRYKWSWGSMKPEEKINWARKKEFLNERGIPYLLLTRYNSSDEYRVIIGRWLRTLDK